MRKLLTSRSKLENQPVLLRHWQKRRVGLAAEELLCSDKMNANIPGKNLRLFGAVALTQSVMSRRPT